MVKLVETIKRKEGTTHEEFVKYWKEIHAPIIAKNIPYLVRYVQHYPVQLDMKKEAPYDGIAELWWEDVESWQKSADWYLSSGNKAVYDSELNFCERSKTTRLLCTEFDVPMPKTNR